MVCLIVMHTYMEPNEAKTILMQSLISEKIISATPPVLEITLQIEYKTNLAKKKTRRSEKMWHLLP